MNSLTRRFHHRAECRAHRLSAFSASRSSCPPTRLRLQHSLIKSSSFAQRRLWSHSRQQMFSRIRIDAFYRKLMPPTSSFRRQETSLSCTERRGQRHTQWRAYSTSAAFAPTPPVARSRDTAPDIHAADAGIDARSDGAFPLLAVPRLTALEL